MTNDERLKICEDFLSSRRPSSAFYKLMSDADEFFTEHFKGTHLETTSTEKTMQGQTGNLIERIYAFVHGIAHCESCGKPTAFKNRKIGYSRYCGECRDSAGGMLAAKALKKKAAWEDRTDICKQCGEPFTFSYRPNDKNIRFRERRFCSPSCRAKYYHEHASEDQIRTSKEKRQKTCLEKYGDPHVVNSKYTREKTKEKLGVEYVQYLPNFGEICTEGYKKNHNGESYHHTKDTVDRIIKTKIEKYGSLLQSCIKYYDYEFPSGRIEKVQGHEGLAIDRLLLDHDETDIIVGRKNIENEIGSFSYNYEDKTHTYYPDIYVKSENRVIEVKSPYTYEKHEDRNRKKELCVLEKGVNFEFWVIIAFRASGEKTGIKQLTIIKNGVRNVVVDIRKRKPYNTKRIQKQRTEKELF